MIGTALCVAFVFTIPAVIAMPIIVVYLFLNDKERSRRMREYDETIGQPFDKI